jgi:hypothetical protein
MLSLKSMSGKNMAENTLRLPSIPLGMPSDGFCYLSGWNSGFEFDWSKWTAGGGLKSATVVF